MCIYIALSPTQSTNLTTLFTQVGYSNGAQRQRFETRYGSSGAVTIAVEATRDKVGSYTFIMCVCIRCMYIVIHLLYVCIIFILCVWLSAYIYVHITTKL